MKSLFNKINQIGVVSPIRYGRRLAFEDPRALITEYKSDMEKDRHALSYSSPHHLVWCAGLPKSGSTLIEEIFEILPFVRLGSSLRRRFYVEHQIDDHGLTAGMFSGAQQDKYSFLKTHTSYSTESIDLARAFQATIIVSVRDLRDMMVSRYHHVMVDRKHWQHSSIVGLDPIDGFIRSLIMPHSPSDPTPLTYYYHWLDDWLSYAEMNDILCCWYEDYKNDPICYINDIITTVSFDSYMQPDEIESQLQIHRLARGAQGNLGTRTSAAGRTKSTFRAETYLRRDDIFNSFVSSSFDTYLPGPLSQVTYENRRKPIRRTQGE